MNNKNQGVGDYIVITSLAGFASGLRFGFEWFGLKALLMSSGLVLLYAILIYIVNIATDKFRG